MKPFKGQYLGAALRSFVRALQQSEAVVRQILRNHGLERIDEDQWYDLNTARSIYYTVGAQVGERSLHGVGLQMIGAAQFPPGIDDIKAVLTSLDAAYRMNCRGPEIGAITCDFEGDHTAVVVFATPFPCALSRGILQGCAKKFAADALIEHSHDGCVDRGDPNCCFHVDW
ncbi:hypothetical protein [Nannocystis radixulma]|uniref:4-vinyl reductase 4VR domain-containing protein n=1 Tax=Nannocystis radixulma TaxID=2995305 RepID=A0ABT5B6X9_9BACT|nr:hypothetical protein [Nannocystis radixulma]MDC0669868.1 hypothetical protein [Nannocystis radixulma]